MSETTITDKHFADWESWAFGYGYGTGEPHTLGALRDFLAAFESSYDYERLENTLGERVAWLLINTLCHADILEYGTSPRYGWLTERGRVLREFVAGKSLDELYAMTCRDESAVVCSPDYCNCEAPCKNPLFPGALG